MAVKSRKYQESTAQGFRAALRLFEKELSEEEKASIDVFRNRFEQIYRSVFSSNSKDYTAESLEVYKKRVQKVLGEYESYGTDPAKFSEWGGSVRVPSNVTKKKEKKAAAEHGESISSPEQQPLAPGMNRLELSLRDNVTAVLIVPRDLTLSEAEKLKTILSTLVF